MQKHILVVFALLLTGIATAQNQRSTSVEQTILDLEHRWIKAATERDVQNVSQLTTEHYVYIWPDGSVHERKEYPADVGKTTWQMNEISETRIIAYEETAIVIGKWRCAMSQSSEIPK